MFECVRNNNLLWFMCVDKGRVHLWSSSLYASVCVCVFLCVCLSLCACACVSLCVSAINLCLFKYNASVLRILLVPVLVLVTAWLHRSVGFKALDVRRTWYHEYREVKFNKYDKYDYKPIKIKIEKLFAKFDLKYRRVFRTDGTYLRMFPIVKHNSKLVSKWLLLSYSLYRALNDNHIISSRIPIFELLPSVHIDYDSDIWQYFICVLFWKIQTLFSLSPSIFHFPLYVLNTI